METEDIFYISLVIFLPTYIMAINAYVDPAQRGIFVGLGYVAIIGIIFAQEGFTRLIIAPFPYLEATLAPSGVTLGLYLTKPVISKQVYGNFHSTESGLAWPAKFPVYGKSKRFVINHEGAWSDRVHFGPGKASYHGFRVPHSQMAKVILYEPPEGTFDIDHSQPIPVYLLKWAIADYHTDILSPSQYADGEGNPVQSSIAVSPDELITAAEYGGRKLKQELVQSRSVVAERTREAMSLTERVVQQEEIIKKMKSEITGLLKGSGDFTRAVIHRMLDIRQEQLTIENALKMMRGPGTWSMERILKILAPVAVFGMIMVYLYYNPEAISATQKWISQPLNAFIIIALGVLAVLAVYFWRRRG